MQDAVSLFKTKIHTALDEYSAVKVNAELAAEYVIQKADSESFEVKYFNTKNAAIYQSTNLRVWFEENVMQPIQTAMEEFQERDSGWTLRQILSLTINVNKLNPMRGSSYIQLPLSIQRRQACVNVRNDNDDECFKWAVLSKLHPAAQHSSRVSKYKPYEAELDFTGIDFPVLPRQIAKFERQNDLSVNLYMLKKMGKGDSYEVSPCHVTASRKEEPRHVNLLLVQDYYVCENEEEEEEEEANADGDDTSPPPRFHYVWIKNLSRLVSPQLSDRGHKLHICDRCLHYFRTEDKLRVHQVDCDQVNKCRIKLPTEKQKILKFENFRYKERVPVVVYADFECLLKPLQDERAFQEHQAFSVGYYVKSSFDGISSEYKSYRQEEEQGNAKTPAEWFVSELQALKVKLEDVYASPKKMYLTEAETRAFSRAISCHICGKPFTDKDENKKKKVRDHCHLTGRYRGAAHQGCNLNFQDSRCIPVIFHNLSGYDAHLLIKQIATAVGTAKGRVSLIPENKERYISFTKHFENSDVNFRFVDSFRFMPSSLEKLASYLEELDIVKREFEADQYTTPQIELLKRKGVFPYEFVTGFDKLAHKELPAKQDFYSKLNDCPIADEEYAHARRVWDTFEIETLGEYSDLYLKTDVLLLADVFENFRSTCIQAYGLDPAHYYTTPGLTWDAMLKYTQVALELLTDIDMLMFVERGIRGGISQCCNRYAKANNAYMREGYQPKEEDVFLMYYDVNNLYGWAMTQALPYGNFQWVDDPMESNFFDLPDDSPEGYILEVDLEYPERQHDEHKDLPLCAEHRAAPGSKQLKLVTTLYKKERYVVHYRALKQALRHGLELTKVHRALRFRQCPWLKPYVDLNTQKRKESKNEFDKLFFKLMINAVYGKTMENVRKRVDVKLVTKWHGRYGAEALIAKPNFHSSSIFDENLVAVQLARTEISIQKPVYVGLCVLDLSKTLVYDFHYAYMRQRVGDRCKLLYTDTDSLVYEVRGVDMYEIMKQDLHKFDTSDYAEDNPFAMPRVNKKVLGLMKDECNGKILTEFIGLRSKMYCVRIEGSEIKKAKGVKIPVVKKIITFADYYSCLFDEKILRCEQYNIRSRLHILRTEKQTKVALSPYDDKRCLLPGKTDTLPWGHYAAVEGVQDGDETRLFKKRSAAVEIISLDDDDDDDDDSKNEEEPPSKRARIE